MKLVEAEAVGPVEGEEAVVTPPRPPHRRVSVSLLFTLTVLTGTVVAIYMRFPARDHELLTTAMNHARAPEPTWDLAKPTVAELRAWTIGVAGKDAPLPPALDAPNIAIIGARQVVVLDQRTAAMRLNVGGDLVTYFVQHARGMAPARTERTEGELRAIAWRRGPYAMTVIGPARSQGWLATFGAP
jgi:hypothetical protein